MSHTPSLFPLKLSLASDATHGVKLSSPDAKLVEAVTMGDAGSVEHQLQLFPVEYRHMLCTAIRRCGKCQICRKIGDL